MSNRIHVVFEALKKRLLKNALIEIQQEHGSLTEVTFLFNSPADKKELDNFFKLNNWNIPDDYLFFLELHNGAKLFTHPEYGGGLELFSLSSIPNIIKEYGYMFPNYCYPIGYLNAAIIYINSENVANGRPYLFWQSCLDQYEHSLCLNCSFEEFIDLFIISQGTEFWLWPTFKIPSY